MPIASSHSSRLVTFAVMALLMSPGCNLNNAVAPVTSKEPVEVTIVGSDFSFTPNSLEVPLNRPIHFTFENKGQMAHDIEIVGTSLVLHAAKGASSKGEYTFTSAGPYKMVCTIPGHKEYGMDGVLTAGTAPTGDSSKAVVQLKPLPAGIARLPQPVAAPPLTRSSTASVQIDVETKEVTALLDDGVGYRFWTFDGTVPGPMMRVKQGDQVTLTIKNSLDSLLTHSIDLHAVTGPGGGAKNTQIPPGGKSTIQFQALNPGVYVYHCATPKVAHHITNGMYGLIVVEPPQGLPEVDREFYAMQGEFYLEGERGQPGLHDISWPQLLDEKPDYVVFNGSVGAIADNRAFKAKKGETVRIFFGVGGPNVSSSFHVIGEIFDKLYREGSTEFVTNVQTTTVPPGGAAIVDMKLEVPGTYVLVDHSLGRIEKGAAGYLVVEGEDSPTVFKPGDFDPGTADNAHDENGH